MRRLPGSVVLLGAVAVVVIVALLLSLRGGGEGSPSQDGDSDSVSGPVADGSPLEETLLRVSPATVLLTAAGETRRLRATLPDGGDAAFVTWHSDDPDVVSVDADGTVRAHVDLGSVVIRAIAGGRQSPPVLVYVAQPADGAVLVADEQVEGNPTAARGAPPGSYRYLVRLRGVDPPAVGAIVLATGEAPVGGRVVSARRDGEVTEVTLEVVPPEEMFARIEIERVIDLTFADVEVPERILDEYDVRRLPDGTYEFEPKATASRAVPASSQQLVVAQSTRKFELGPFECETQVSASPISLSQPLGFTVSRNLSLDLVVRDRLERFIISGQPRAGITVAVVANVEFFGKVECKAEVFKVRVPIGGALAYLFGVRVPMGVGMEIEGKITVARLGFEVAGEVGADYRFGVACPDVDASCSMVNTLSLTADGSIKWNFPDPEAQFRVEPSVFAFLFVGGELGSDLLSAIEFEALELKAGLLQEANLAPVSVQIADAAYASSYELKLKGEAEAAQGIDEWLALFRLRTLKIKAEIAQTLHRSPTGTASADVDEFRAGDTVVFEVLLQGNLFYPLVGYNVDTVSIVRRVGDEIEQIATTGPEEGADRAELRWRADSDGNVGQDFYAFVLTKLLPIPELEVGQVTPGTTAARETVTPGSGGAEPLYACEVWLRFPIGTSFWTVEQYTAPGAQCALQLADCQAGEGPSGEAGFHCAINPDRHRAYVQQCGNTRALQRERGCIP